MTLPPAIDYTNKDYAALRNAMLELARYRLPEWTDRSPADLVMLLIDLFAHVGDVALYYQDRIADECFLATATERRSVGNLLRLIGYELKPPVAASADLTLRFNAPQPPGPTTTTVPKGAQFTAKTGGGTETFEYLGPDLTIDLLSAPVEVGSDGKRIYSGLPVRHSRVVPTAVIGSSTGEPNQKVLLAQGPLIPESLLVEIDEGAGFVPWRRRQNLLYHVGEDGRVVVSGPQSRDYYVQFDEKGRAFVHFGDGEYGFRPPVGTNNIRASYRVGGGTVGNVSANSITQAVTPIPLLASVTNPSPAAGGADEESVEHARRFAPLAYRASGRAVTLGDFAALAHQAGGVAKVRARSPGWNEVELFIAPEGSSCRPVPDELRTRLLSYFEDKRMVTTSIVIRDPYCVPIDVSMNVVAEHHYDLESVRARVESAVRGLVAFENVDFGHTLYLSKVYEAVEAIAGVHAVTVTHFRRQDAGDEELQELLAQFGVATVEELPDVVRRTIDVNIAPDGRILIDPFEIPTLGTLSVQATEVAP